MWERETMFARMREQASGATAYVALLTLALWGTHWVWLRHDTRPPVWDMALHQIYALNYFGGDPAEPASAWWERSGNYPPFVHLAMAAAYRLIHPAPHVAVLANIPATVLLFWAIYTLGLALSGPAAARWACALSALIPYTIWLSRETVLDYWLSAWLAAALALLYRSRRFELTRESVLFGIVCGLGMLTKWLFALFVYLPVVYVVIAGRLWANSRRTVNLLNAIIVAAAIAAPWYLFNIPRLVTYFPANARIGALEGEPPVFSWQSFIYYLRLLEGYQLFGLLFALTVAGIYFAMRRRLIREPGFWICCVAGAWLGLTLLRTKDPRFSMPLLGILALAPGAWIASWRSGAASRAAKIVMVGLLAIQAYMINFGIPALPRAVVIADGYRGSLQWNWNLYLQDYFGILGAPAREDWRQEPILKAVAEHARPRGVAATLAIVPDLARFNAANFNLYARLHGLPVRAEHPQSGGRGIADFEGYDYAVMTEAEQGMSWTTKASPALNQTIVDFHEVFRLIGTFPLPNGDSARLYYIRRAQKDDR